MRQRPRFEPAITSFGSLASAKAPKVSAIVAQTVYDSPWQFQRLSASAHSPRPPTARTPARRDEAPTASIIMRSLFPHARFQIESLRGSAVSSAPTMEAIMLDVAFVALGIAILALMGVYALALRQF